MKQSKMSSNYKTQNNTVFQDEALKDAWISVMKGMGSLRTEERYKMKKPNQTKI